MTKIIGDSDEFLGHFRFTRTPYFFGFSSLGAMLDTVKALPKPTEESAMVGRDVNSGKWSGSTSLPEALKVAQEGWKEGLERAEQITSTLSAAAATKALRLHAIAGGSVNVGRLLAGNPAHMRRRAPQPGKRVITLFVENSASAAISSGILIKRAAMIAATSDILENAGYSCEIISLTTTTVDDVNGDRLGFQMCVKLKSAGERLNLADTVFAFGHPSFLRRFSFVLVCSQSGLRSIWQSQGYPSSAFDKNKQPGKNEFYFPMLQITDLRKVNTENNYEFFKFLLPKWLEVTIRPAT